MQRTPADESQECAEGEDEGRVGTITERLCLKLRFEGFEDGHLEDWGVTASSGGLGGGKQK